MPANGVDDIGHSNVVGAFEPSFPNNLRYFAAFQGDQSRYLYVEMMGTEGGIANLFVRFAHCLAEVKSCSSGTLTIPTEHSDVFKFIASIERMHSDKAKEYIRLGNDLRGVI